MSLTILIALILLAGGVGYFFYDRHQNKKQEQHFEELRAKRKTKRESAAKKQAAVDAQRKKNIEAPVVITPAPEPLLDPAALSTSSQTLSEDPAQDDTNAHWWDPPPPTADSFNPPVIERVPLPAIPVQPPVKGITFQDDKDLLPVSESLEVAPTLQTSAVLEDAVEETSVISSTQEVQDDQDAHPPAHFDKPAEFAIFKAAEESAVAPQIVIDEFQEPALSEYTTFNTGVKGQDVHTSEGSPSSGETQSTDFIPLEEFQAFDLSAPDNNPPTNPLTEDFPSGQNALTVEEATPLTPAQPLSSGVVVEYLPHQAIQEYIDISDDILDELVAEEERSAPSSHVEPVSTDVVDPPKETTSYSTQEVVQQENVEYAPSESPVLVDKPVVVELSRDLSHAAEETSALPTHDAVLATTSDSSNEGGNASDELAALLGSDGSSWDFNLPFDNDLDKLLAPISSDAAGGGESSAPSVLLVDDSRSFRIRMENILREGGCQVTACVNGREAFDFLRSAKPPRVDVIISDIDMPEMDGYTFFTALQAQGNLKSIPFIIVTGSYENVEKANRLGVKEALVKPFGEKEIEDALRRQIPQFF